MVPFSMVYTWAVDQVEVSNTAAKRSSVLMRFRSSRDGLNRRAMRYKSTASDTLYARHLSRYLQTRPVHNPKCCAEYKKSALKTT